MTREEDTISRQAVLNIINANCVYENEYNLTAKHIKDAVESLPSTTPKTGHWIKPSKWKIWHECDICHKCPTCHINGDEYLTKYCPNCGAKMEIKE